jgi:cobaltochelatase CobS
MIHPSNLDLAAVHPTKKSMVEAADNLLVNAGLPSYSNLASDYTSSASVVESTNKKVAELTKSLDDLKASPSMRLEFKIGDKVKAPVGTGIPEGEITMVNSKDAFGMFDFEVPAFSWKSPHPLVPEIDKNYQFDKRVLIEVLYCLIYDKRAFLTGHTGTGKSTHIEQVAARLNWPLIRANFDSELTRMEVVGKEALRVEVDTKTGQSHTVTEFVETILPTAMRHGYIFLGDEWDSIRPDVAFVMQPILEGKPLVLLEDESKIVPRHPMFRMFATGNTRGQGDESGIYNGTRPQNAASMDRFEEWVHFDYPTQQDVVTFIKNHHPDMPTELRERISKFVREYWNGFERSEITTPLSYRGVGNICSRTMFGIGTGVDAKTSLQNAINATCNNKATENDISVINGLIKRVFSA